MDLKSVVDTALKVAMALPDEGERPFQVHRNRSKNFVESLADQFRKHFSSEADVRVLSKHYSANRGDFGLNELLFDVLVCRVATVPSATESATLTYVTHGTWAVESEFARDSREALFDFNKLVLAATDNILFIGPAVADPLSFLAPLSAAAAYCQGATYAALIPHPSDWGTANPESTLYRLHGGHWSPA